MPGRARFNLTYSEIMKLPIRLRDRLLEQLEEWRIAEDEQSK